MGLDWPGRGEGWPCGQLMPRPLPWVTPPEGKIHAPNQSPLQLGRILKLEETSAGSKMPLLSGDDHVEPVKAGRNV